MDKHIYIIIVTRKIVSYILVYWNYVCKNNSLQLWPNLYVSCNCKNTKLFTWFHKKNILKFKWDYLFLFQLHKMSVNQKIFNIFDKNCMCLFVCICVILDFGTKLSELFFNSYFMNQNILQILLHTDIVYEAMKP